MAKGGACRAAFSAGLPAGIRHLQLRLR